MPFDSTKLPVWNNAGTEPPQTLKDSGWGIQAKPPADYFNWQWNLTYLMLKNIVENAQAIDQKGQPNGYAGLDSNGKVINSDGSYPNTVQSVNNKTGAVTLTASDVGAETPDGALQKINTAIANLINGAPGALDTLKELADAIGDDQSFASTIINRLTLDEQDVATHKADYVMHDGVADATGSANTYAITLNLAPTAYAPYQTFKFKANTANTGAATLNVNGLGAIPIRKNGAVALSSGDIPNGAIVQVVYDGTYFQLLNINIPAATTTMAGITTLSTSTSSTSTTQAATPSAVKSAYDLANGKQKAITSGTADPSGGVSGDIYLQYS